MSSPSSSYSPQTRSRFSSPVFETRQTHRTNLPILPTSILRRILHFRLALPPLSPTQISDDPDEWDDIDDWDNFAGKIGRQVWMKRIEMRKDVQRAACDLMLVCKAFRPIARAYLFTEPHINHNFEEFAQAIKDGEKKWSDINVRSDSTPGRYVKYLDLSNIQDGYAMFDSFNVEQKCADIVKIMPNLAHLRTNSRRFVPRHLAPPQNPHAKKLQALEVPYRDSWDMFALGIGGDDLPNLKVLRFVFIDDSEGREGRRTDYAIFPKLHSLFIDPGIDHLIDHLHHSKFPAVCRLILPSDYMSSFGIFPMANIRSLTFVPEIIGDALGQEEIEEAARAVLEYLPNLIHLSYLLSPIPPSMMEDRPVDHPLRHLTISKWSSTSSTDSPSFIDNILSSPPPNLKTIRIDNYKWVKPTLGRTAMQTGDSSSMRSWSAKFLAKGIELRDMDNNSTPALPGGGGRRGSFGSIFGGLERGQDMKRRRSLEDCDEDGG